MTGTLATVAISCVKRGIAKYPVMLLRIFNTMIFPSDKVCVPIFGSKLAKLGIVCFVLGFYGPVNPMGSCRARSVYLTTRLLGRLSPLSG